MPWKHGESFGSKSTTRARASPEYISWSRMKQRCYNKRNPDYKWYGGCGIRVCRRWRESFTEFLEDMGRRPSAAHSLERLKSDRSYCKANCVWATAKEQARNRANNHKLTLDGVTKCMSEWCEHFGIGASTLWMRLRRGWTVHAALTTPVRKKRSHGSKQTEGKNA